jgi:hypothetical protein
MNPTILFFFQAIFGTVLVVLVTSWYVMPRLRALPYHRALELALYGGAVRYMGTILLAQGVVDLPPDYQGAIGDVIVASIALAGIIANHYRSSLGRPLAWAYVVIGGSDLVLVTINGFRTGMWSHLAGAWTFVVLVFPPIVVALAVTVLLLAKPEPARVAGALSSAS